MKGQRRLGFTLIELLVVIAIIAILAAILFPVFAQAKVAAKKTADLSNVKQLMMAVLIYSNDYDDLIPNTREYEPYVFAARTLPYTKNKDIFRNPASSSKQGTIQRKQHDNGFGDFMTPPDHVCVGLGTSTVGTAQYYNDKYPALDYLVNQMLFGYQSGGCAGGNPGDYSHPGPNATSGAPGGQGTIGVGPGGLTFTNIAKVVLWVDFPVNGNHWPGAPGVPFWGGNFKGYFADGSNVSHMDGHAAHYKMRKLTPNGFEGSDPANAWSSAPDRGTSYHWWGTNFASAENQ